MLGCSVSHRFPDCSSGASLSRRFILLAVKQDAAAAKRFLAKALGQQNHPAPRVITDGHAAYPPAIAQLKTEGALAEDCRHRRSPGSPKRTEALCSNMADLRTHRTPAGSVATLESNAVGCDN